MGAPATGFSTYLGIFFLICIATLFAGLSFYASGLLGPKKPTRAKTAPYECGIVPSREPAERFPVRFYLIAMIFIIFDIEIIFLYPWAVIFHQLRTFGMVEILVFSAAVVVSFIYLISNGALDWGPARRLRTPTVGGARGSGRTTESTVRRHGPGGRPGTGEAA
ncbi:MAG TPA: NADH-quinone oxidoreductase subunit A [Acidimicrobiales bacterium]|nr:NADH-quinone oxidoreductase subunit A [Acidimicrobiales bacterium]